MLTMLQELGIIPSFSRPSVSDDNPYSESLFKTAKYHNSFPRTGRFATILDARTWAEGLVTWYNTKHLHSALKFVTLDDRLFFPCYKSCHTVILAYCLLKVKSITGCFV